jgi:hypothetical protein
MIIGYILGYFASFVAFCCLTEECLPYTRWFSVFWPISYFIGFRVLGPIFEFLTP